MVGNAHPNRRRKYLAWLREAADEPVKHVGPVKFMSGVGGAGPMLSIGVVEQTRQALQTPGISRRIVDCLKNALVVEKHLLSRPQGVKIQTLGALITNACRIEFRRWVQATFLLKPARELRIGQGVQQADHANRDRGLFYQLNHALRDRTFFTIDADNKSCRNKYAGGVYLLNALDESATGILLLLHGDESVGVGTFNPYKYPDKVGLAHGFEEIVIVR